ncbi:MAG: hypothetical protein J6L69_02975 [Lachnospiraceae bacterium]|nr:hypothetical protein [Lachnospiraceae bacterium]
MYKFTNGQLDELINHFASLFEYDYAYSTFAVPEGIALSISFYNSPCKRCFDVELIYDECTYLNEISDIIINTYKER